MPYAISNPADEKCLTAMTPRMLVGTAPIANGSASFGSILPSRQNPIDALAVLAHERRSGDFGRRNAEREAQHGDHEEPAAESDE